MARARAAAGPVWRRAAELALLWLPIAAALAVVLPAAVELGEEATPAARQATLAWRIFYAHVGCFVSVSAFLALAVRRSPA
jgi:hypothetical protein